MLILIHILLQTVKVGFSHGKNTLHPALVNIMECFFHLVFLCINYFLLITLLYFYYIKLVYSSLDADFKIVQS